MLSFSFLCSFCLTLFAEFFLSLQFSPHGGVLHDAGSTGDAGPELAHCVQRCW